MTEASTEISENLCTQDLYADVAIAGGGLNGPALALALAQAGLSVVVVDEQPVTSMMSQDFDGRSYALALSSCRLFKALGLWSQLEPQSCKISEIIVSDGRVSEGASPCFLHFDSIEMKEGAFGSMIEDQKLRPVLLSACMNHSKITYLSKARITASGEGWLAFEKDGTSHHLRASLLVAADGRRSLLAARAGIRRVQWSYGQTALVCTVAHEKPHHGIAHEYFLPSGPFAILPLTENRSSIVWTEKTSLAHALMHSEDSIFFQEFHRRFGDFLGKLNLIAPRWAYPLDLTAAIELVKPRLALIGDAARGMHPIAGQGLNYGLRDVAALAEVLVEAFRRGEDIGSLIVLERYQSWRRFDNSVILAATDSINRLFSNDIEPLRWLRRLGLKGFGATGPARRLAMSIAAGTKGDLPRLLRGEAL